MATTPTPGIQLPESSLRTEFLDSIEPVLHGVSQVMLQKNALTGLIFLAGIFYSSPRCGIAVIVGTMVSTLTAAGLGVEKQKLRDGLFGFNGALTAIVIVFFLQSSVLTWVYLIFAAALSTVLMAAMIHWLEPWKMSPLTAPFVLTAFCFVSAYTAFGRLHPAHMLPVAALPKAAAVVGRVGLPTLAGGLWNGLAQVFFQSSMITGVLFAVGLLIASRRSCAAALVGSAVGSLLAWPLGAAEPAIHTGVFGFNCALTAIAMVSLDFVLNKAFLLYTLAAIAAATIVFAAVSAFLQPVGLTALTLPFVLVVWVFASGAPHFPRIQRKPVSDARIPANIPG